MALYKNVDEESGSYVAINQESTASLVFHKLLLLGYMAICVSVGFYIVHCTDNKQTDTVLLTQKQRLIENFNKEITSLEEQLKPVEDMDFPFIGQSTVFNAEIKYLPFSEQEEVPVVSASRNNVTPPQEEDPVPEETPAPARKTSVTTKNVSLSEQFAMAVQATNDKDLNFEVKQPHKKEKPSIAQIQDATPLYRLPDTLQAKIPQFTYNAHNYSTDAKRRSLTLNGKELHEGDNYGKIEIVEIKQDYTIMRIDGQSFSQKALSDNK